MVGDTGDVANRASSGRKRSHNIPHRSDMVAVPQVDITPKTGNLITARETGMSRSRLTHPNRAHVPPLATGLEKAEGIRGEVRMIGPRTLVSIQKLLTTGHSEVQNSGAQTSASLGLSRQSPLSYLRL